MTGAARALLFLVRVYQSFFSALMPSACKFYPSCSHYAADALKIHGARRGSWLALRRVLRCHPFTRGGVDLVPEAELHPREPHTVSLCHSERGEEFLCVDPSGSEGSFASLRMTTAGAVREGSANPQASARHSGSPQAKGRASQAEVRDARGTRP